MALIIAFEPNVLCGGYGDRIVGIIALKLIATKLKKPFGILWSKEDVDQYIDYPTCETIPSERIFLIDRQQLLKNYLMYSNTVFPNGYIINLNQEIAQYLYKNTNFNFSYYFDDIFNMYKTLYTEILVPKFKVDLRCDLVGVQIRCGDAYILSEQGAVGEYKLIDDPKSFIKERLEFIKGEVGDNFVFLTSDYSNIYDIAYPIFKDKLIYDDTAVQHIDRSSSAGIDKTIRDNYILSQHTAIVYITPVSNYGRVAALSSTHDEIFDLYGNRLNKKTLLSNQEMLF